MGNKGQADVNGQYCDVRKANPGSNRTSTGTRSLRTGIFSPSAVSGNPFTYHVRYPFLRTRKVCERYVYQAGGILLCGQSSKMALGDRTR
ncbi:hypothetical protein Trydic_g17999 [Trypoxylus dichotomus]